MRLKKFPYSRARVPKTAPPKVEEPEADDRKWSRSYLARLARLTIVEAGWRPIVATFAKPEVKGLERLNKLDENTPIIFTANHRSHADTPILLTTIPEPWRHKLVVGAAKDYFFSNSLKAGFFALTIGAIPIERTKLDRKSGDLASKLIQKGWSLIIYPEGGRSPDGWGQPFRGGAAYLAGKHNVAVVPVYLEGTRNVLPRGKNVPQRTKTMVIFGDPIFPTQADGKKIPTRRLAEKISVATDSLADELSTNWWEAAKRKHQGKSPTSYGPDTVSWLRNWKLPTKPKRRKRRTAKNPW